MAACVPRARTAAVLFGVMLAGLVALAGSALAQDAPQDGATVDAATPQEDVPFEATPQEDVPFEATPQEGLPEDGFGDAPAEGLEGDFGATTEVGDEGKGAAMAIFLGSLVVILAVSALIVWQKTRENAPG